MTLTSSELTGQVVSHQALFKRLQHGHTLVTGNSRLTRVLTAQYNQWRIEQGHRQWRSPDVLSWNQWMDRLWQTASLHAVTGSERAQPGGRQLINLWESILRRDALAQGLLRPESLANQLRDTRHLLREWRLDLTNPAWFGDENENHSAFIRWNKAFEKRCEQDNWIAPEDRFELLSAAVSKAEIQLDRKLDLLGFDEFNPAQNQLLKALIDQGMAVKRLTITPCNSKAVLWQGKDNKDELQRMARWTRHWYETEAQSTIAIVVPDLQNRRQEVERQLQEILMPEGGTASQQASPWNISMGTALAVEPLIQTAFDLLKLLDSRIDIQVMGRVLRSPWLRGGISERNSRALLEKCLRENYPRQLKLKEMRYRSEEIRKFDRQRNELPLDQQAPQTWNSPKLSAVLSRLAQFQVESRRPHSPSHWAEILDKLLASLGWPLKGDARTADPAEMHDRNWQALQAWRDALRELASLDATVKELSCTAAIGQLHKICREKIFQPVTQPARIQVLGLYEISGLRFDHLWVLGLHNDNWPPTATPNPFLPGRLQSEAGVPHSSPQRELEVARTITRRLLETAPDCVFSYPSQLDGEGLLPSPLLINEQLETVEAVPGWAGKNWQHTVAAADKPQTQGLIMPGKLRANTARGGSSIIKHQALCPFRAFASNRLAAEGLESPADGISAMLHGSLIHSVLEYFWSETKSQDALLQLDDESLGARVRECVNRVVSDELFLQQRPAFARVEADRLWRQAMASLALEKTRDSFEAVEFEKEILPLIEGQTIRLIIDRIDRLPSGEEIIIDYKTGKVDPKKWFSDRPEDPQLPLYAISAEETPAAVVFAVVRDDGCLYRGVVKREGLFPGLPPRASKHSQQLIDAGLDMPVTIDNWRQVVHQLMASFLAGEAQIDPKHGRKTCDGSYCELQALCRIGELEKIQQARDDQGQPGVIL